MLMNSITHILFLDESGNHDLNFISPDFPIFVLCGCLIQIDDLEQMNSMFLAFKKEFFYDELGDDYKDVILVSSKIRKQYPPFQLLKNRDKREKFYCKLNHLIAELPYKIIATVIRKKELIDKYAVPSHPYNLSLEFIIERMVRELKQEQDGLGLIVAEARASTPNSKNIEKILIPEKPLKREDLELYSYFHDRKRDGTRYADSTTLHRHIEDMWFVSKYRNIAGLQIADLSAYPIAGFILDRPTPAWEIIETKLAKYPSYIGKGLKIFPL